ncbi:MAG: histidine phosphatase family protein [Gemmatimonadaceae bacterium]|nr:histidine phosphatase family protein [Gemmatimonadaceae bacterium]
MAGIVRHERGQPRLYLIRHAAVDGTDGRCIGQTDLPLGGSGRAQCDRLAAVWQPPAESIVWCSDLTRATQTAHALAARWRLDPSSFNVDADLRECSFGEWDGRAWAEIEATDGARLGAWMQEWRTMRPPGGESLPDVATRARRMLHRIVSRSAASHVVIAHAGVLRAMLCEITGAPESAAFGFAVPHAHVSAVTVTSSPDQGRMHGTLDWLNGFLPRS